MRTYKAVITRMSVMESSGSITDDDVTHVELIDLGGGAFVTLRQNNPNTRDTIEIDAPLWPHLQNAINDMLAAAQGIEAATLPPVTGQSSAMAAHSDDPA